MERRGSTYDPLIVDTFLRVHRAIEPELVLSGPPPRLLNEIAAARKSGNRQADIGIADAIVTSADEVLMLYELAQGLAGQVSLLHTGDLISRHLRRLLPASLIVFFIYDEDGGAIEARHAVGDGAQTVRGLRISFGQGLSGWVAANQQTIINSDATLDLGEAARSNPSTLRSCLSTPLVTGDRLVGVLSIYSSEKNGFSNDHRRVLEAVSPQIANTIEGAIEFDESSQRDELTGLPSLGQLKRFLLPRVGGSNDDVGSGVFLVIRVCAFHEINATYGRAGGDEALRHVARRSKAALRVADILFRASGDQFVAYLSVADPKTAETVAEAIRTSISACGFSINGTPVFLQVEVIRLLLPKDNDSLKDFLSTGRSHSIGPVKSAKNLVH